MNERELYQADGHLYFERHNDGSVTVYMDGESGERHAVTLDVSSWIATVANMANESRGAGTRKQWVRNLHLYGFPQEPTAI